jgi:Ca-activated chloride channel family protein
VWIDGQPVIGEVLKKEQARKLYEAEKAAGREAGLTEKKEHYRFEVSVSPVRANQDVRIRMVYLQTAHVDHSMGRYVYPLEEGQTDSQADAFWSYNPVVKEDFSFNVNLRSSYPVTGVRLPEHPAAVISNNNDQEWQINLGKSIGSQGAANAEEVPTTVASNQTAMRLDKDIVVYWRLAPNLPGSIDLITHREAGAKRGTFMMTVTPGDDLAKITEGRDWAFVLDMSGSMSGKYQTMVDAVQGALNRLNPDDRFQITLFDDQVMDLTSQWINATPENVTQWGDKLASTAPRGSTNLYAGLKRGLSKLDADRTGAIILVTDGEANVGITEKKKFLSMMEGHDVRLFTAVMGNGANRPLLNAMTEISNGFAVSVSNSDDIAGKLMEFTSKVSHQALHDVSLKISGIKTADFTPEQISSLYRGEQLVVFGHYWGSGEATVTLKGKVSGEDKTYSSRFDFPEQETLYPEIERLWAYAKIQSLQDKIDYFGAEGDYKNAIVDLAVENSLVTNHTSMIVMRDEQFAAHGIERKNKQRRAKEEQAKTQRSQAPVVSHRVDTSKPAFSKPRASHSSGGGGGGSLSFLLLLPLVLLGVFRRRLTK